MVIPLAKNTAKNIAIEYIVNHLTRFILDSVVGANGNLPTKQVFSDSLFLPFPLALVAPLLKNIETSMLHSLFCFIHFPISEKLPTTFTSSIALTKHIALHQRKGRWTNVLCSIFPLLYSHKQEHAREVAKTNHSEP